MKIRVASRTVWQLVIILPGAICTAEPTGWSRSRVERRSCTRWHETWPERADARYDRQTMPTRKSFVSSLNSPGVILWPAGDTLSRRRRTDAEESIARDE